jgi:hypothetical protein
MDAIEEDLRAMKGIELGPEHLPLPRPGPQIQTAIA